jgi:hypothetical protein
MVEAGSGTQSGHSRPEVRFRGIPELLNERVALERLLHDSPLDPFAASVTEADFAQAGFVRGGDEFFDWANA